MSEKLNKLRDEFIASNYGFDDADKFVARVTWNAALSAQAELANDFPAFDEKAAYEKLSEFTGTKVAPTAGFNYAGIALAKWQHAQTAAQLDNLRVENEELLNKLISYESRFATVADKLMYGFDSSKLYTYLMEPFNNSISEQNEKEFEALENQLSAAQAEISQLRIEVADWKNGSELNETYIRLDEKLTSANEMILELEAAIERRMKSDDSLELSFDENFGEALAKLKAWREK